MKRRLLILLLMAAGTLKAQKSDTLLRYFSAGLEPVAKPEGAHTGKVYPVKNGWGAVVTDSVGHLVMTGTYRDKSLKIRDGLFAFYYPSGQAQVTGNYSVNRQTGLWISWHPNGQMKDSVAFSDGIKTGKSKGWHENGLLFHEGYYIAGYADSSWTWYYPNGKPSTIEKYTIGNLRSLECFDSSGKSTGNSCSVELPPTIMGRYGGLQKYIVDSLYYPKEALDKNIQGIVEVQFTITKEGKLRDVKYLNTPDKLLSDEVTRLLQSIPGWYPAILHNQVVDFTQTLKIPFYKPGSTPG
ncbi:MAG: energy transducer TonB [Chitinophagaceae bacterium]|nr:energy transducer TonB [Chitinophagaceae bacterium]